MTYAPRISVRDVITIHDASIRKFGGATGLRDENLLISALAQPFQTFEGVDLYPGVVAKACRCAFGIIANHPFIDGNKRTGAAVLGVLLRLSGYDFHPNHDASIRKFGGATGLRDENLLISALAQPFQTFEGVDLYPGVVAKACRCAFGIIANHPFIDGNKRTGAAVLGVLLRLSGYDFHPNHEAFLRIIFGVADGTVSCSKLTSWVYLVLQIPDE